MGLCSLSTSNNNLGKVVAAAVSTVLAKRTTLIWKYIFLLLLSLIYEILFFCPLSLVLRHNVNNCASLCFGLHCSITLWLVTQGYSSFVKVCLVTQGWSIRTASFITKAFRNKRWCFQQRSVLEGRWFCLSSALERSVMLPLRYFGLHQRRVTHSESKCSWSVGNKHSARLPKPGALPALFLVGTR